MYLAVAGRAERSPVHGAGLEDPARFKPQAVTSAVHGHAWDHIDPAVPKFEKMPEQP